MIKKKLRSESWFNNPDNPSMTALYLERYLNFGLTRKELQSGKPIIGIAGRVVDARGKGIAGATVVVEKGGETNVTRSAADGHFKYGEIAEDVRGASVTAIHMDHAPSERQTAEPGTEMILQLGPGGRVMGLISSRDGAVEKAANVSIIGRKVPAPDPNGEPLGREVVAKVDGTFEMGPLRPGTYDLLARSQGKSPGVLRGVTVQEGGVTEVIINMGGGAKLIGVVMNNAAATLGQAQVTVFARVGAQDISRSAIAGPDGRYVVDKLPPGEARIRYQAVGHLPRVDKLMLPERGEVNHDVQLRDAKEIAGTKAVVGRIGAVLEETEGGVVMRGIGEDSVAGRAGINDGDVLVSVDFTQSNTRSLSELAEDLNNAPPTQVTLEVRGPDDQTRSVYLSM